MSADRRKEKLAHARPLAPRLATAVSASRSSPAPRLAPQLAAQVTSPNISTAHRSVPLRSSEIPNDDFSDANITPRSAARKARPDLTSRHGTSTPPSANGQMNAQPRSRPALISSNSRAGSTTPSMSERSDSDLNRMAPSINAGPKLRPLSSNAPYVSSHDPRPTSAISSQSASNSTFFYANERPVEVPAQRPSGPIKSPFLYANGTTEDISSPIPDLANATAKAISMQPVPDSSHTNTNSVAAPSAISPTSQTTGSPFFRSSSPTKENFHLTYRRGVSQILRPPISTAASSSPEALNPGASSEQQRSQRRSSIDGRSDVTSHSRGASQSSVGSLTHPLYNNIQSSISARSPESFTKPLMSPTLMPVLAEANQISSPTRFDDANQKPLSAGSNDAALNNDPAAEARRERKVLDLEITNNSLLAINRSLEREVRKQKSEMRRMRRMTRNSNRQSWFSQASDMTGLSALDEGDTEGSQTSDEDAEDASDSGSLDEDVLSPEALAQQDARHQRSDKRRLQLDLSRHKELLIDSQKLNQSIKRCLGVTEQLIGDGRRALEYRVRPSEVKLGGRVLSPEELEEHEASFDDGYFVRDWDRPSSTRHVSMASNSLQAVMSLADKDSGAELEFRQTSPQVRPARLSLAEATAAAEALEAQADLY